MSDFLGRLKGQRKSSSGGFDAGCILANLRGNVVYILCDPHIVESISMIIMRGVYEIVIVSTT